MAEHDAHLFNPDSAMLCQQIPDPDMFFPDREVGEDIKIPKQICLGCDARIECLTFAIERPDLVGIWGGTTTTERKRLRRGAA